MYIISEIGVNHNGCLETAKSMIRVSKDIGADCVKFQSFSASRLARKNTPKTDYQKDSNMTYESHFDMLSDLELNINQMRELKYFCEQIGIDFLSTPYDPQAIDELLSIGCKSFKVASADLTDIFIHKKLAEYADVVYLSIGMATFKEIRSTLDIYNNSKAKITLLHCVSNYPCSPQSVNMNVIKSLKKEFNLDVGFSDHTLGSTAAILSVSFGVTVIEKHFTLDREAKGPDHQASSEPHEFKSLIDDVKSADVMLGKFEKVLQDEEISMKNISRKSLVYKSDFTKGHIIKLDDLTAKRPGCGISPQCLNDFIGKKLIVNVNGDQSCSYEDFD